MFALPLDSASVATTLSLFWSLPGELGWRCGGGGLPESKKAGHTKASLKKKKKIPGIS